MKYQIRIEDGNPVIGYNIEKIIDENSYSVEITLGLESVDGVVPPFSKSITVISNNSQTGFEVDAQRELEISNYMKEINK